MTYCNVSTLLTRHGKSVLVHLECPVKVCSNPHDHFGVGGSKGHLARGVGLEAPFHAPAKLRGQMTPTVELTFADLERTLRDRAGLNAIGRQLVSNATCTRGVDPWA